MGNNITLQLLPQRLLSSYKEVVATNLKQVFEQLHEAEISSDSFSFYTSVASVYSSKIEGEPIDLDSYIKHKKFGVAFQPDYTKKIDDLYAAYTFTKTHRLNEENVKQAHILLSKNLLQPHQQGVYRKENMFVIAPDGKIEYVAALPAILNNEMQKLFNDVQVLLNAAIHFEEVFYFASMLHLVFVKIHPWSDGNGRAARLLEKWFIAEKLGEKAWFIQSEKYYYHHHHTYYANIRTLGLEYEALNYNEALPFLLMLPESLLQSK